MFNKEDGSNITFWDAAWLAWDLTAQAVTSVWKWAYDLVDMWGDGISFMTDLFTNVAADVTGKDWLRTSFSANKWIIDKWWELVAEWKKQINEATKSKLRDTNEGQLAFDVVWTVWEFVAPAGWWAKVVKKIDSKAMVESLKKIPKAMDEIKAMMSNWEKMNQSKIMNIYEKYSWEANVIPDFQKLISNPNVTGEQVEVANMAMKAIDSWADFHNIKWFKELPRELQDYVLNFSQWKWWIAKDLSYVKSDRMMSKEWQMDDIVWKYNAPSWGITLPEAPSDIDKIVWDFNKALSSVSPEVKDSLMKKHPKLTKAIIGWGGIAAALWVLWAMRADEIESVKNDIASSTASAPNMSKNPEVNMSKADPESKDPESNMSKLYDPDTIESKKKELEAKKEKNAWTLNASTSVVDLMKMLWANSTMEARKILFEKLTSKPYQGTAEQNIELKALVEEAFSTGKNLDLITPIKR